MQRRLRVVADTLASVLQHRSVLDLRRRAAVVVVHDQAAVATARDGRALGRSDSGEVPPARVSVRHRCELLLGFRHEVGEPHWLAPVLRTLLHDSLLAEGASARGHVRLMRDEGTLLLHELDLLEDFVDGCRRRCVLLGELEVCAVPGEKVDSLRAA